MIVKRLECVNFRNYDSLSIDFSRDVNILFGDNAQGKTNILEGIYLCATTKSHKGNHDKDLIKIGANESHIKIKLEKNNISRRIDIHLKNNKTKGIALDGIPVKKSSEVFGLLRVVFFSPEDLGMIKNGPSERRKFIDMELCQLNIDYLHALSDYNKTLVQRNNLLKQIGNDKSLIDTLDIWDLKLIEYGKKVISARKVFIEECSKIASDIHFDISGKKEKLVIKYDMSVDEDSFENKLLKTREHDLYTKTTNIGPHRDDMVFYLNNKELKTYGSQGQQRTVALSLKLAEIQLMKEKTGENPVLLLDDVLSELDRNRQTYLLEHIKGIQTLLTCTGLEEFIEEKVEKFKTYQVVKGTVEAIN